MQDPVSSRSATSQSRLLGVESGLLMVSSTRIGHRYFLSSSTAASQRVHDRPHSRKPRRRLLDRALLRSGFRFRHHAGHAAGGARPRLLIAAMAGFLVMALAIPEVFGAGALTFGLSFLFVVALHLGAFAFEGPPLSTWAHPPSCSAPADGDSRAETAFPAAIMRSWVPSSPPPIPICATPPSGKARCTSRLPARRRSKAFALLSGKPGS